MTPEALIVNGEVMTIEELEKIKKEAANYLTRHRYKKQREVPKIKLKNTRRGWALDSMISIPKWIFTRGKAYATYYVIHEVVHYYFSKHTRDFKRAEVDVLKQFGIVPRYKTCYPRALFNLDGDRIYPIGGMKIDHFKKEII